MSLSASVLLGVDQLPLGNEDTVEELALVLGADLADLADLCAAKRQTGLVVALEDELVLDIGLFVELHGHTGQHLHELVLLATEEVLDFDLGAVLGDGNVDGEVSVHKFHSVAVALQSSKYNY